MASSTRDQVLQVAMRLFGEHGYAATTIARIGAEAGPEGQLRVPPTYVRCSPTTSRWRTRSWRSGWTWCSGDDGPDAATGGAAVSHYWLLRGSFQVEPFGMDEDSYLAALAELTPRALTAPSSAESEGA